MTFTKRVQIGIEFSNYIKRNNIVLSDKCKERRKVFISWYMERFRHKPFSKVYKELAHEVLWIEEITLESLMFNEK